MRSSCSLHFSRLNSPKLFSLLKLLQAFFVSTYFPFLKKSVLRVFFLFLKSICFTIEAFLLYVQHFYVAMKEHCRDAAFISFDVTVLDLIVLRVLCLSKPWDRKRDCCHRFGSLLISQEWIFIMNFHLSISIVAVTCFIFLNPIKLKQLRWILLRDICPVTLRGFWRKFCSITTCFVVFSPKAKVNEAEKKYKAIQDKLITVSEEAQALHPQCISLKAEVQAKRKAVHETEVGKKTPNKPFKVHTSLEL